MIQTIEIALGRTTEQHDGYTFERKVSDFIVECKFGHYYNSVSTRNYQSCWIGGDGDKYVDECTFYTLTLKTGHKPVSLIRVRELVESIRVLMSQDSVAYRVAMNGKRKGYIVGTDGNGEKMDFKEEFFGV